MAVPKQGNSIDVNFGVVQKTMLGESGCVNDLLVCTYDESHVVSGGRYVSHLNKCALAHGNKEPSGIMQTCPFDKTHQIHHSVMWKHIELCDAHYKYQIECQKEPPSMRVEYERYKLKNLFPVPVAKSPVKEEAEENQDDDQSSGISNVSSFFLDQEEGKGPVSAIKQKLDALPKIERSQATSRYVKEATTMLKFIGLGRGRGRGRGKGRGRGLYLPGSNI